MMNSLLSLFGAGVSKLTPAQTGIPALSADGVVSGVLHLVYYFGGIVCVIVIIVAGILYTLSSGDAGKTKQAKDAITYAVVGLIVIMLAFVITSFVIGRF